VTGAFSSEAGAGSRQENATDKSLRHRRMAVLQMAVLPMTADLA
jgi:hypothetical protein